MIRVAKITIFLISCMFSQLLFSSDVTLDYIDQYKGIAIAEMQRVGIPASIKMAQAILESSSGQSTLARESNNHFGIKCGKNWTGREVYREDDDYNNGLLIKSCFRAFDDPAQSFYEHSEFLANPYSKRYKFLFELDVYDYEAWAKGLKKAGYATDPNYPKKLITIIEKYELYHLDLGIISTAEMLAQESAQEKTSPENNEPNIIASNDRKISTEQDLGQRYVNAARTNRKSNGLHKVQAGESMAIIAAQYNVGAKELYVKNRMKFGDQPAAGQDIAVSSYKHLPQSTSTVQAQTGSTLWKETITIGGSR